MLLRAETAIGPEETAIELGKSAGRDGRGFAGRNAGSPGCRDADFRKAGSIPGDPGADPEERRWIDRLAIAGACDS